MKKISKKFHKKGRTLPITRPLRKRTYVLNAMDYLLFSAEYSWLLSSRPKSIRKNLRDVNASALLC